MTTWYMFGSAKWSTKIEAIEIEKHSEKSVYINGRRRARFAEYGNFFPTFEEAHSFLLNEAEADVARCRRFLERANGRLGNIKGMKKP